MVLTRVDGCDSGQRRDLHRCRALRVRAVAELTFRVSPPAPHASAHSSCTTVVVAQCKLLNSGKSHHGYGSRSSRRAPVSESAVGVAPPADSRARFAGRAGVLRSGTDDHGVVAARGFASPTTHVPTGETCARRSQPSFTAVGEHTVAVAIARRARGHEAASARTPDARRATHGATRRSGRSVVGDRVAVVVDAVARLGDGTDRSRACAPCSR